jgi:hypothetical protein
MALLGSRGSMCVLLRGLGYNSCLWLLGLRGSGRLHPPIPYEVEQLSLGPGHIPALQAFDCNFT